MLLLVFRPSVLVEVTQPASAGRYREPLRLLGSAVPTTRARLYVEVAKVS